MKLRSRVILFGLLPVAVLTAVYLGYSVMFAPLPKPVIRGMNEMQWLQLLKSDANEVGHPLRILRIDYDDKSNGLAVEVPLSYDALMKNDFFEGNNRVTLKINTQNTGYLLFHRSTSGKCVLELPRRELTLETNQIQAMLWIANPVVKDRWIEIIGPGTNFVTSNLLNTNGHQQ